MHAERGFLSGAPRITFFDPEAELRLIIRFPFAASFNLSHQFDGNALQAAPKCAFTGGQRVSLVYN